MTKLLAAFGSVFLLGAAPELSAPMPIAFSFDVNPKVRCGNATGSGVRIADDRVLTARHVVHERICGVDGRGETARVISLERDFAELTVPLAPGARAIVSCEGILPGESYLAMGYPFGGNATVSRLIGTNQRSGDGVVMLGRVYPGMSGGGVYDDQGRVAGITVRYHQHLSWAFVVPLRDTYVCKDAK